MKETVRNVRDAVVAGDVEEVLEHVSPHFFDEGMDKEHLRDALGRALRHRPVSRASYVIRRLDVSGGLARARIYVQSHHGGGGRGASASTEWSIRLERADQRWLVTQAKPLTVEGHRVAGLRVVLMMAY